MLHLVIFRKIGALEGVSVCRRKARREIGSFGILEGGASVDFRRLLVLVSCCSLFIEKL